MEYSELSACSSTIWCRPNISQTDDDKNGSCQTPIEEDSFHDFAFNYCNTMFKTTADSLLDYFRFGSIWRPIPVAEDRDKIDSETNASSGWNTEEVNRELQDVDVPQSTKHFAFANTVFSTPANQSDQILFTRFPLPSPPLCKFSPVRHPPCYTSFRASSQKRFCQTKIMELWHLLSTNIEKSKAHLHDDLWLPPNEDDFTINMKIDDYIKTILALRTPIWPPNVAKILLICVKKIPCGRDDSCLRRLRDQTRWMKNDLNNHVAAYKSFRQLKYNSIDYWYLPRHSCEFNLERLFNSPLYAPVVAEILIRDLFHGLHYLHTQTQHLFHGNLKPSNVLIDLKTDGRLSLVLVDFGFGRLRCPRVSSLNDIRCYHNEFDKNLDDLCWKPPEFFDSTDHWSAAPKYDTPSDVYSAALLAYFMLTRQHPFINRLDMTLMHLRRAMHEERHALECVDVEMQSIFRPLLYHDAKMRPKACDVLKQLKEKKAFSNT